jgi:hypothetical protein
MPNVLDNEDLYNVITLGTVTSPGRVTLSGHNRKITWDIKEGQGLNGATTTLKAIPPIEFSASFYLLRDPGQGIDDYATWDAFQDLIRSTVAATPPTPLDIYHPDLARNDIKSVCAAEIGGPVYDGKGGCTIVVKFQEYRPPKKQGGTPSGSKKGGPADPNADLKAQLERLTQQYQATPWG